MKRTGGEIVVDALISEGVPYILGIPGHGVMGLFDAVRRAQGSIQYIQVKHEQAAAAVADGYFRVSGKPLACFSSIGPGTLNACIGLATAYVDSTSFLQLCGDTHIHMKGVGVLQEVERYQDGNISRALEPLAKRVWRAESAEQLPRIMRRAFSLMKNGRGGPVAVMLPMDVQCAAIEERPYRPAEPESRPCADAEAIGRALALMKQAKRPVILAGGGALRAKAGELIEALAETWGAAMVTTLAAKGTVRETHPLYGFHTGSKGTPVGLALCRSADVILAVGTRFADETACSYRKGVGFNFPDTKLIHVDIDPAELGKNYAADVGIAADLTDALEKLVEAFGTPAERREYRDEIARLRADWAEQLAQKRAAKTDKLTISQLVGALNEHLLADAIIATSSGNTQAQLFQEYCYKERCCNLTTGGFSTMGWAFPAALGAKLACPKRTVVALVGDGDFMMVMQELSTMAQYDIPVIVVVADNAGWMAIKDLQLDVLGEAGAFGNDFLRAGAPYSPDFVKTAEAFGVRAERISRVEECEGAISRAVAANAPYLIHADVCRDYPNSGGKAYGWWDVPIPEYEAALRAAYERARSEETV
ncbi:MAG TPA: thiamine pyrophosphate-binding protein [Clostridia bacterium]|nr:thiamine pyrophosphate-binding protein [Clostridia bacterium]